MYVPNDFFVKPNHKSIIWKYMDFPKFLNIITQESLYFNNVHKFDDKFEGKLPPFSDTRINTRITAKQGIPLETEQSVENRARELIRQYEKIQRNIFLNCWHINNYQSAAMWDSYSSRNYGLAIKSTVGRLINSFHNTPDKVYIGKVKYQFEELINTKLENYNLIESLTYKRKSFACDKELRLFISSPEYLIENLINKNFEKYPLNEIRVSKKEGKDVKIDIKKLIDCVCISPLAPDFFERTLKSIIGKYSLDFECIKSDLYQTK